MSEVNSNEEIKEKSEDSLSLKEKFFSKKKIRKNNFNKNLFLFFGFTFILTCGLYIITTQKYKKILSKITKNENLKKEKPSFFTYIDSTTNKEVKLSYILTKNPNTDKTILLCHGMFRDKNSEVNLHLLEGLKNYWSIIRFDFEGNGESSGEWSYADYPREVRDIGNIVKLAEKNLNLEIVGIIGYSKAGADVFISAATQNLIPNKECCFISLGGRITFGTKEKRFTKEELDKAKKEGYFLWERSKKLWNVTQVAIDERKNMNPKKLVKNIDSYRAKRILQVQGTKDENTPIEEAYVIEKEIPGAEIKWIQDSNHSFKGKEKEMVTTVVEWLKLKLT